MTGKRWITFFTLLLAMQIGLILWSIQIMLTGGSAVIGGLNIALNLFFGFQNAMILADLRLKEKKR